jgi:hypothetical protein
LEAVLCLARPVKNELEGDNSGRELARELHDDRSADAPPQDGAGDDASDFARLVAEGLHAHQSQGLGKIIADLRVGRGFGHGRKVASSDVVAEQDLKMLAAQVGSRATASRSQRAAKFCGVGATEIDHLGRDDFTEVGRTDLGLAGSASVSAVSGTIPGDVSSRLVRETSLSRFLEQA